MSDELRRSWVSGWPPRPVEVVALALIAGVVVWLFWPKERFPLRVAHKAQCMANCKQLASALRNYAVDSHGRLPAAAWYEPLLPYAKDWNFQCPLVNEKGRRFGFALNYLAMGQALDSLTDPHRFILVFETDALATDVVANLAARTSERHGKGAVAAHADGSAKFYPEGRLTYGE